MLVYSYSKMEGVTIGTIFSLLHYTVPSVLCRFWRLFSSERVLIFLHPPLLPLVCPQTAHRGIYNLWNEKAKQFLSCLQTNDVLTNE
jgi:hypothetical protein